MEYYCSKVSPVPSKLFKSYLWIQIISIANAKFLIATSWTGLLILFQDKAVAFKIFELGLKVRLAIKCMQTNFVLIWRWWITNWKCGSVKCWSACRLLYCFSHKLWISVLPFQKYMNETDYVLAYVDYLSHLNGKFSTPIKFLTPKIWFLILSFSCYTFPCELVTRNLCEIKIATST